MRAKTAVREPESVLAGDAAGAMTGKRYIASLKDGREVWIDGKRVADVTTHPAFKPMIDELARVYDLQNSPKYRDEMTFVDPETGIRSGISWLLPRSADDLKRKRRNSELWNELTWGQLGRSPDILAPYIISALHLKDEFGKVKNPHCDFGENLANYYKYCLRNDLFLTHALGDPQVDRSEQPQNEQRKVREDEEVALHVVEETKDGVIVTGGKQLSTAAPHSNECYVSLSATFARRNDPKCVLAFSIPTNSPGLKILAREPVGRWFGSWGHPLQMLDEQDCMLFFDHVLVPWDRLFMLYDSAPMVKMLGAAGGSVNFNFLGWANLTRVYVRMRLMTAVATMIADAIGVSEYREVGAKLGEMVTYCELWRHAMEGVEHEVRADAERPVEPRPRPRPSHLVRPDLEPDDRDPARDLRLGHHHAAERERPRQSRNPPVPRPLYAGQGRRCRIQVAFVPAGARSRRLVLRHAPGYLRILARRRSGAEQDQSAPQLRSARNDGAHQGNAEPAAGPWSDAMNRKHRRVIPGTPIFDGVNARKGYALNKMCFSFNDAANRAEFARDEDAYCAKFHLTQEQRDAVKHRNVLELIAAGGNIYYLAKLAGIYGLNVQDLGAQQTGMTVDAFTAKLLAAGK